MGTLHQYDQETWKTMLNLKRDIIWYLEQNNEKYKNAIKKEKSILTHFMKDGFASSD